MKKSLWLLLLCTIAALCVTAQAEIVLNDFPSPDAIPETYSLLGSEMPPYPTAEFTPEGTVRVSGLAAWDVSPEMMTDWELAPGGWAAGDPALYEDQLLVTGMHDRDTAIPGPGEGFVLPLALTGGRTAVMVLDVHSGYDNPGEAEVSVSFRNGDGTEAALMPDGMLHLQFEVDTDTDKHNTMMLFLPDGTLDFVESSVFVPGQVWYERLGSYELRRVTDCLSGERFDELTVRGGLDPDAVPFRMAGEPLPVRVRITDRDPYAWGEEPAIPVLDPLPAEGLPEQWPDGYPDACPAFTCEVVDGKYVWTVFDLLSYGARVNLQGETYADPDYINYFRRSYTRDEVPEDRIRLVMSDGFFHLPLESERGPYRMELEGDAVPDDEGNLSATLAVVLEISDSRSFSVVYINDGTTGTKRIILYDGDRESAFGEYGEDNLLKH